MFFDDGQSKEIFAGPAGEQYILSFDAKSNVENAILFASHRQGNSQGNQIDFGTATIGTEWNKVVLIGRTIGTIATSQRLYLDLRSNPAGTEIEIKNLKLEKDCMGIE